MKNSYNYCFDTFKGIICILIVFMHCEFPGLLGQVSQGVSRFSVPFFFMISGYFCFYEDIKRDVNYLKKIRHIALICMYAILLYVTTALLFNALGFVGYDLSINLNRICDFLLFNRPFIVVSQMWFLFALLYDYVLFYFIKKYKKERWIPVIIVLTLIIYIIMTKGLWFYKIRIPNHYYRNWLIEGSTYFLLGYIFHKYKNSFKNIGNYRLVFGFIISTILVLMECYLLKTDFGVNVFSIPQLLCLFVYGINNPKFSIEPIRKIGNKCSMLVYLFHPFVWHILENLYLYARIDKNVIALYLQPILVVIGSLLLALGINKIKESKAN